MFFFILGTLWITSTTSSRDAVATPLKLSTRSLLIQGIAMTELDTKARPPSREDDAETRPEAQPRDAQPRLAVVTYNVWFDSLRYTERCDALFEILEASAADVICLQEVLPPFLQRGYTPVPKAMLDGPPDSQVVDHLVRQPYCWLQGREPTVIRVSSHHPSHPPLVSFFQRLVGDFR